MTLTALAKHGKDARLHDVELINIHTEGPALYAQPEYEANAKLALELGVFGAPFYVVDGERFWGQDRLTHLDWHLSQIR